MEKNNKIDYLVKFINNNSDLHDLLDQKLQKIENDLKRENNNLLLSCFNYLNLIRKKLINTNDNNIFNNQDSQMIKNFSDIKSKIFSLEDIIKKNTNEDIQYNDIQIIQNKHNENLYNDSLLNLNEDNYILNKKFNEILNVNDERNISLNNLKISALFINKEILSNIKKIWKVKFGEIDSWFGIGITQRNRNIKPINTVNLNSSIFKNSINFLITNDQYIISHVNGEMIKVRDNRIQKIEKGTEMQFIYSPKDNNFIINFSNNNSIIFKNIFYNENVIFYPCYYCIETSKNHYPIFKEFESIYN